MTQTASEIVVAGTFAIYVAAVGTTAPADESASWPSGWTEIGYTEEDGVKFHDEKTVNAIRAGQAFYPVRRIITARDATVSFNLEQWDKTTFPLAFGGGAITTVTTGHYRYDPPAAGTIDERALGLDVVDGSKKYRFLIPKGMVSGAVDTEFVRTKNASLPITFGLTTADGGTPWYKLTNDPAMNPA